MGTLHTEVVDQGVIGPPDVENRIESVGKEKEPDLHAQSLREWNGATIQ